METFTNCWWEYKSVNLCLVFSCMFNICISYCPAILPLEMLTRGKEIDTWRENMHMETGTSYFIKALFLNNKILAKFKNSLTEEYINQLWNEPPLNSHLIQRFAGNPIVSLLEANYKRHPPPGWYLELGWTSVSTPSGHLCLHSILILLYKYMKYKNFIYLYSEIPHTNKKQLVSHVAKWTVLKNVLLTEKKRCMQTIMKYFILDSLKTWKIYDILFRNKYVIKITKNRKRFIKRKCRSHHLYREKKC